MNDQEMMECSDGAQQMNRLRAIMHRLRAAGGCPWDAEQTHASLVGNLIEETYECVDAIQRNDMPHLQEELGDLLLQVVFHAEIAEESGHFNFDDVARGISEKLVRRHPHVYGDSSANDSEAVLSQWDAIKRQEKGDEEKPYLHGVGQGLPALLRAAKLQKKAAKVGFDWPDATGVIAKIIEELLEFEDALDEGNEAHIEEELGDILFSVVNLARFRHLNPEQIMAAANRKFEERFGKMEQSIKASGSSLETASLAVMEHHWQAAKAQG